jgi:hypothetical protein
MIAKVMIVYQNLRTNKLAKEKSLETPAKLKLNMSNRNNNSAPKNHTQ